MPYVTFSRKYQTLLINFIVENKLLYTSIKCSLQVSILKVKVDLEGDCKSILKVKVDLNLRSNCKPECV